jgi:hypothetical protein
VTGPEFVKAHGAPLGDQSHAPWTAADYDVWDHLNAVDVDEQALKRAAVTKPVAAPDTTTGGNR